MAWESDFEYNPSYPELVEYVDIIYFCGHGSPNVFWFGVNLTLVLERSLPEVPTTVPRLKVTEPTIDEETVRLIAEKILWFECGQRSTGKFLLHG